MTEVALEAVEVEKSDAELYLEASAPRDITVDSGLVFRVRGITHLEHGEVLGQIPEMKHSSNGTQISDDEKKRLEREAQERVTYERFCDGLVDRKTGAVTKIPFERVFPLDFVDIANAIMNVGGLGGAKAAQIRRSLRES